MNEWDEYLQILDEVEEYQKWAKRQNKEFKDDMLTTGPVDNTSPYTEKAPTSSLSGLGPLAEVESDLPRVRDDLNRNIWNEDNKLKSEIREKLLQIARDFYDSLDLKAPILDITLTGSIANYNWTDKSDVDLHIVIDYLAENEDTELVKKFLSQAKSNWNKNHEIMIKDHEVESYVQDSNEPHHSTGVYSVMNDEWIIEPEIKRFEVSEDDVFKKSEYFTDKIDSILGLLEAEKTEEAYGDADRLTDKLRKYRQSGLETGGEFSVENLVFKILRNSGYIEELYEAKRRAYDSLMSLDEASRK
jgi:predicted nucleotidyltransferase